MSKVAIVTPYYKEDIDVLNRCHTSVLTQTYEYITHFMVADGDPHPAIKHWTITEHIILPKAHSDAGATPRVLGAISAFSQGYDAVAFLDADNTFEPNHIDTMVSLIQDNHLVTSTRNICRLDGTVMYVDTVESDGDTFCDTNCLFLSKNCIYLLPYWIVPAEYRLWSDRNFWGAVKQSNLTRVHSIHPTVNYYTRWAWHYEHAGQTPPDDSVWIDKTPTGELIHRKHKTEVIENAS